VFFRTIVTRYRVYLWGFACLDYSLDVLISWTRKLSSHNSFFPHLHLTLYLNVSMQSCMCILTITCNLSAPRVGFPPLGGRTLILCKWNVPPLGELCLYTPGWDVSPHGSVNIDLPTGLSRQSYMNWNSPLQDLPRSETMLYCRDFPSQGPDFAAPWRDVPPLGTEHESNSIVVIFPSRRLNL